MNHRKLEHPSNRTCSFFLKNACIHDSETCWYKHETKAKSLHADSCHDCDNEFSVKSDLMKHRKKEHRNKVLKCRNYNQGNCSLPDQACWFLHDENVNVANENSDGNHESEDLNQNNKKDSETENYDEQESEGQNLDFHKVQEKTPPDQINKIMNLINKLSLQLEKLEKMSI